MDVLEFKRLHESVKNLPAGQTEQARRCPNHEALAAYERRLYGRASLTSWPSLDNFNALKLVVNDGSSKQNRSIGKLRGSRLRRFAFGREIHCREGDGSND